MVDGKHWDALHCKVWCDHTEETLELLGASHICDRLLIHCVFKFFLGCKVADGVDDYDDIVLLIQCFKLCNNIKLQLFHIHYRYMQDTVCVNTECVKVCLR